MHINYLSKITSISSKTSFLKGAMNLFLKNKISTFDKVIIGSLEDAGGSLLGFTT